MEQWWKSTQLDREGTTINFKTYFKDFCKKKETSIIFDLDKYILSSSTLVRIEIDSQRLKYTLPSPTHTVHETLNFDVFHATLGPVDKAFI